MAPSIIEVSPQIARINIHTSAGFLDLADAEFLTPSSVSISNRVIHITTSYIDVARAS